MTSPILNFITRLGRLLNNLYLLMWAGFAVLLMVWLFNAIVVRGDISNNPLPFDIAFGFENAVVSFVVMPLIVGGGIARIGGLLCEMWLESKEAARESEDENESAGTKTFNQADGERIGSAVITRGSSQSSASTEASTGREEARRFSL